MNEIIRINSENDRPTVSGRELHEALEVNSNYTTWFNRMCEYGFIEGNDFRTCFPNLESENQHGGQNKIDHLLSIDMAKEICMLQRSDKGRLFRQYFIEVEKRWNEPEAVMARALKLAEKRLEDMSALNSRLENKIAADAPKVLFADSVSASRTSILIGDLAKLLRQNGVEIGQKRLFEWLRRNGYLMKTGSSYNMPTQRAADMGLFEVKVSTISTPDGSIRETKTTKVTGKGQVYFVEKFLSENKRTVTEAE